MREPARIACALIVLGSFAACAPAQTDVPPQQLERVTVTGAAIKSVDGETSVPVTVVKMDGLRKAGVTSVEQVMAKLTAVQQSLNTASAIGSTSAGASLANLRGIGADKTLVLLNGQRIANNAVDGSAPDLNMIPFAAIDRVEVLRDGASSLYGTDAIGGAINFITKRDYRGGTLTLGADSPQHPGGTARSANAGFGVGDLATQGYNLFGFLSFKNQGNIAGTQRDFNKRIVGGLSYGTSPANYTQDFVHFYNPTLPTCSGTAVIDNGGACQIVTPAFVDFSPKTETYSGMLKGTLAVNDRLTLGAELFSTQDKVTTLIAPSPYNGDYLNPLMPNGQPNPYYPTTGANPNFTNSLVGAPAFKATTVFPNPADLQQGFVYVLWRDFPNGSRGQLNKNAQNRLLLSADGSAGGWDYTVSGAYNRNRVDQYLVSGYSDGNLVGEGLLEGVINPFGAQTTVGDQLLQQAALTGLLESATGEARNLDAQASREIGDWFGAGRPAQLALGAEYRHEKFVSAANRDFAARVVSATGVSPNFLAAGSRRVDAVYAELKLPLLEALELTASARYDRYSDFGSTTNPKLSLRYQPTRQLVLRGSASTGFRAPTLYELYGGPSYTVTSGNYANPLLCPGGTGGTQCAAQFQVLNDGNPGLQPEKSRSGTLGAVYQPAANASVGLDFWWIRVDQSIGKIPQLALFSKYNSVPQLQQYFHFAAGNTLSIASNCPGPRCGYVDQTLQNLGDLHTNGVDLSATHQLATAHGAFDLALNSTYVAKYASQDFKNGYWVQNVGTYGEAGPVFRWQHNLAVDWQRGGWGAGAVVHFKSGYVDAMPSHRVASYTTTDLFASWGAMRPLALVVGVRNLADHAPPFTDQKSLFQAGGWDSRYADPTGRAYYVRGTCGF
ncbi:MAG: TonB-dependent receptor [Pelomonas sp.]|nr:TonB-dependent receptor [Roseateles sp.]